MDEQLKTLIELSENGYNLGDFYDVCINTWQITFQGFYSKERLDYYTNMGHTFEIDDNGFQVSLKDNLRITLTN